MRNLVFIEHKDKSVNDMNLVSKVDQKDIWHLWNTEMSLQRKKANLKAKRSL